MTAHRIEVARGADLEALCAIDVSLVARDGDEIVGYLTWDLGFFLRPFVRLVVVAWAYRRYGIGRALVATAEREATGFGEIFISTEEINAPMRALLLAAGYVASGAVENINAPGNVELIFYKHLGA